jgi:hypothetical protein
MLLTFRIAKVNMFQKIEQKEKSKCHQHRANAQGKVQAFKV